MKSPRHEGNHRTITRRDFLTPLAFLPLLQAGASWAKEIGKGIEPGVRMPEVSALQSFLTPNETFFVRNHFATFRAGASDWNVRVTGQVRTALALTHQELLLRRPIRTLTATLECAGNGVGLGAVGTAIWTGISLEAVLKEAGVKPAVKHVRLVGADRGREGAALMPQTFARSIPLEKALHPDTLLAIRMNGVALPAEHGFPVRALVPGWYGMDSVKWLVGIEALDHEDESYFMTRQYIATRMQAVGSEQVPITRVRVKSQITQPREGEILALGSFTVRGAAWAGEHKISHVEVSTNGGREWTPAALEENGKPYAWVQWKYLWQIGTPGIYTVAVRATDDQGNTQPSARDAARFDSYELNSYHSIRCEVR